MDELPCVFSLFPNAHSLVSFQKKVLGWVGSLQVHPPFQERRSVRGLGSRGGAEEKQGQRWRAFTILSLLSPGTWRPSSAAVPDSQRRRIAAAASSPCVLHLLHLLRRRCPQFLREGPPPLPAHSAAPSLLSAPPPECSPVIYITPPSRGSAKLWGPRACTLSNHTRAHAPS